MQPSNAMLGIINGYTQYKPTIVQISRHGIEHRHKQKKQIYIEHRHKQMK